MSIGIAVNCYERTYRALLKPGTFAEIADSNAREFDERVVIINNVTDRLDALERAEALRRAGEISSFSFVSDLIDDARVRSGLPRRAFRQRPYFLDFGLVMPLAVHSDWLVGWDPEVRLERSVDWISPAIDLMCSDHRVFSASVNWPARGLPYGTLPEETVEIRGPFWLNWNFSDQVFLVRRRALNHPIYRSFAPAAWIRNFDHPFTFESRIEAYQRAKGLLRATYQPVRYTHHDLPPVTSRLGKTRSEKATERSLLFLGAALAQTQPNSPRWRVLPRHDSSFAIHDAT